MPKITSAAKLQAIAEENDLFLVHLRNTGNVTLAAGMAKRDRTTFKSRRRVDREFDERWRAAISFAQATLNRKGASAARGDGVVRAAGGEYSIGPNRAGNLQVRRARPGHVTAEGERAFLDHLAVTANIQLAAEAVGVDPRAFYKRRRNSQTFAQAMGEALSRGYDTVELSLVGAALRSLTPELVAARDDQLPEGPQMTIEQAMALLSQRTKTLAINDRHVSAAPAVTPKDAVAAMLKKLAVIDRHNKRYAEKTGPDAGDDR